MLARHSQREALALIPDLEALAASETEAAVRDAAVRGLGTLGEA
jgi:hypothetical protein